MTSAAAVLRLDEAVELCTAWLQTEARDRGIRSLVIKGPLLADQGLRRERTSSDVDVLVDPAGFDRFVGMLEELGWEEFPGTFASEHFTLHSRTFRRDGWPNSVDVHGYYPGFLREPAAVFDTLWERRATRPYAHVPGDVTDRVASLLVLALHSLRGTVKQARHQDELDQVLAVSLTDAEKADAAALAVSTGAAAPLREVLPQLGVEAVVSEADLRSPAYREWHRKTAEARGAAASWLLLLARAPWPAKLDVVRRALWVPRADLLTDHPELDDRPGVLFVARVQRLGRGFSRLPSALAALLRR